MKAEFFEEESAADVEPKVQDFLRDLELRDQKVFDVKMSYGRYNVIVMVLYEEGRKGAK